MTGFATNAIHGVQLKRDVHGSLRVPVYDNVAFEFDSAKDINQAFAGRKPDHTYSRITNPTVEDFEQRIRLISGSVAAVAVSSGMAAITNVILTLAGAGTNIVTSKHLFGNTLSLFEGTLKPWGLEIKYADMSDPAAVAQTIDHNTRAVFLESITNPQLEVADFKALSAITIEKSVPLIVDNTVTTPYLFRSKDFGVNVEVLSSTKYITGGATSLGGVIIDNGNFDWRNSPRLKDWAVKMGPLAMLGAFLGWQAVLPVVFLGSVIGSAIGIPLMLLKGKDGKLALPFGPFLSLGALIYLFWWPQLFGWYLRTFFHQM